MLTLQVVINTNVYTLGAILDTQNVIPAGSVYIAVKSLVLITILSLCRTYPY
jgi:hypothetical protein